MYHCARLKMKKGNENNNTFNNNNNSERKNNHKSHYIFQQQILSHFLEQIFYFFKIFLQCLYFVNFRSFQSKGCSDKVVNFHTRQNCCVQDNGGGKCMACVTQSDSHHESSLTIKSGPCNFLITATMSHILECAKANRARSRSRPWSSRNKTSFIVESFRQMGT